MLREIRELGFDYAELSHGIRMSLLPGILDAVEAGEMQNLQPAQFLSAAHGREPCRRRISTNSPPSAPGPRELACRHTLKTIEFAARVKAQLVVLHFGSMDLKDYTRQTRGDAGARRKRHARDTTNSAPRMPRNAEAKKDELYRPCHRDLERVLAARPKKRDLSLGIENREAAGGTAAGDRFPLLFQGGQSRPSVYWHDTGHAQIKENLGFIDHALHLESLARRLAGFHIHDVQFPAPRPLPARHRHD